MLNRTQIGRVGLAMVALCLAGCAASKAPEVAWASRTGANLAADQTECQAVAAEKNINQLRDYSDGRYGAAAAMASRLNQKKGRYGAEGRLQDMIFEDCMTRKGWTKQ